jgi:hypothetical protein
MPVPPIALTRSSTARVEIPLMSFDGLRGLRPRSASPWITAVSAFSAVRRGSRSEGPVPKALIDPGDRSKGRTRNSCLCAASGSAVRHYRPGSASRAPGRHCAGLCVPDPSPRRPRWRIRRPPAPSAAQRQIQPSLFEQVRVSALLNKLAQVHHRPGYCRSSFRQVVCCNPILPRNRQWPTALRASSFSAMWKGADEARSANQLHHVPGRYRKTEEALARLGRAILML